MSSRRSKREIKKSEKSKKNQEKDKKVLASQNPDNLAKPKNDLPSQSTPGRPQKTRQVIEKFIPKVTKVEEYFEIDQIMNHKDCPPIYDTRIERMVMKRKYLIRWKKYGSSSDSWEPYENIVQDAPLAVKNYEDKLKESRIKKHKDLSDTQKGFSKTERANIDRLLSPKYSGKFNLDNFKSSPNFSSENSYFQSSEKNLFNFDQIKYNAVVSKNGSSFMNRLQTEKSAISPIYSTTSSHSACSPTQTNSSKYVKTKINLKQFRTQNSKNGNYKLVQTLENLQNYRIENIEPPDGCNPDQLVYLLKNTSNVQNQNNFLDLKSNAPISHAISDVRITSQNLSQTPEGKKMMCLWLEHFLRPYIKLEINKMKEQKKELVSIEIANL